MEYLKPKFSVFTGGYQGPKRKGNVDEWCSVCGAIVRTDFDDPNWRPAHKDARDEGRPVVRICFWR